MINYRIIKGKKYELRSEYCESIPRSIHKWYRPGYRKSEETPIIDAETELLKIPGGFAWDGASGAIDTADAFRAAMCHDALYEMIRAKTLDINARRAVDKYFRGLLKADGMNIARRWLWWLAVRVLGKFVAL